MGQRAGSSVLAAVADEAASGSEAAVADGVVDDAPAAPLAKPVPRVSDDRVIEASGAAAPSEAPAAVTID